MSIYYERLKKLFQTNLHRGVKLGLENIQRLNAAFNSPINHFRSIHVAGTNGKGSVTTKLAKSLELAGYRVGLFTSPHLSCFRERIQINGMLISEEQTSQLLDKIFAVIDSEKIPATFFEITTLLAFIYFAQETLDYAVIETGIGGRLDATNIVNPILSVITSISLDHTEILGLSREEITREKAGVIKQDTPVVIGPSVSEEMIKQFAIPLNAPVHSVVSHTHSFMEENRSIAEKCLEVLHLPKNAGLNVLPACRFEIVDEKYLKSFPEKPDAVILDVGHNPDGLTKLFTAISERFPHKTVRVLFALSANKDIEACLHILTKHARAFHVVEAPNGRSEKAELIKHKLLLFNTKAEDITLDCLDVSLRKALSLAAQQNEILVICGTFFIMQPVRRILGYSEPSDPVDMNESNLKFTS